MRIKIAIIGCGNVGTHLISAISQYGDKYQIIGCYSRKDNFSTVAEYVSKDICFNNIASIPQADIYILAISDDAIKLVTQELQKTISQNSIILHTSGTKSIDEIDNRIEHRGVLYPLQTFSANIPLNVKEVPFFIECRKKEDIEQLEKLALTLGSSMTYSTSDSRKKIHLSAVFACNFTNHLFSISQNILKTEGIDFNILEPLIKECVRKAISSDDINSQQTGPASRNDTSTIKTQLNLLLEEEHYRNIYEDITNSIIKNGKF